MDVKKSQYIFVGIGYKKLKLKNLPKHVNCKLYMWVVCTFFV